MPKSIKLEPLSDRVIVEPVKMDEKTKSGIILPDSVEKEKPQEGIVIAVGKGKEVAGKFIRTPVKKGNKVLYKKYGGDEIKINGRDVIILESEDILAIIK